MVMTWFDALTKNYLNEEFFGAFVGSPSFVVFVISVFAAVLGLFIKKKVVGGLLRFLGVLIAVLAVGEFILGRFYV